MSAALNPDILRKIRKCLALAESNVPGEAEAALRQAQKLMAIHGVDADTLDRSAVLSAQALGLTGQAPTQWETALVWLCCNAFGGTPLWTKGPKGGWKTEHNGRWTFLAEGQRAELIKYAYTVLVRQVLKARAKRAEERHTGLSRPAKAKLLDDYCNGYVLRLKEKVSPYALTERERKALEGAVAATVAPGAKAAAARAGAGSLSAYYDGHKDGADATFHAAAKGPAEQAKLEHKA